MLWFAPFIGIALIGTAFFFVGLWILRTPTEELLAWDRRTGRAIYVSAPDHETGLRRAGAFYRVFGAAIAVIGPTLAIGVSTLEALS